jgi:predicted transposase YdaD
MLLKDAKLRRIMEKASGKTFAGEVRKKQEEIARNMKNMGIDADTIAKATGLFIDDILRI